MRSPAPRALWNFLLDRTEQLRRPPIEVWANAQVHETDTAEMVARRVQAAEYLGTALRKGAEGAVLIGATVLANRYDFDLVSYFAASAGYTRAIAAIGAYNHAVVANDHLAQMGAVTWTTEIPALEPPVTRPSAG